MIADVGFLSPEKESLFECRTIHSLLFRHYQLTTDKLFTPYLFDHAKDFGLLFGKQVRRSTGLVDDWADGETEDDLAWIEFQRLRALGLKPSESRYEGFIGDRVAYLAKIHERAWQSGFWDFARLLEMGAEDERFAPGADYVAIDEINDLNPLQVKIVSRFEGPEIDQVGDLSQAIYGWAGVKRDAIRHLPHTVQETMDLSHRLTAPVAEAANAIIQRGREKPDCLIRTEKSGGEYRFEPQIRNLLAGIAREPGAYGSVYLLARTNYLKSRMQKLAEEYGLNLATNPEAERFGRFLDFVKSPPKRLQRWDIEALDGEWLPARTYLRYGAKTNLKSVESISLDDFLATYATETLREVMHSCHWERFLWYAGGKRIFDPKLPIVRLDTIHRSKGMEEDTTLIAMDRTERVEREADKEEEVRLAYVAVTRSKSRTFVSYLDGVNLEPSYQITKN